MNKLENKMKVIFNEYKITTSKEKDYNKWDYQISLLGKKMGNLKRFEKADIISNFIKQVILWHNLSLNYNEVIQLLEFFIGKGYDNRMIVNSIVENINLKNENTIKEKIIDYDEIHVKYNSILQKKLKNFESDFLILSTKYRV